MTCPGQGSQRSKLHRNRRVSKMTKSPTEPTQNDNYAQSYKEIPIEIVSEEEMALIEAAMASASSLCLSSSSRHFQANVRSVQSITALSKRGLSMSPDDQPDLEDLGGFRVNKKIKTRLPDSLFIRFRKNKPLSVTDFTSSEWCEKQLVFSLSVKRRVTKAMKAGSERHAKLEEEVVKRVTVHAESAEDRWALKLLKFIIGVNQLLFEGLTRELPIISYVEDIWMVGVIDEIRLSDTETERKPLLVDVKTRNKPTLPSEPQRRNGRLQLMCYKHMWDNLVSVNFPTKKFFEYFSLNPFNSLSKDIIDKTVNNGMPAETLEDVVRLFTNTCSMLPVCQDKLLLRYESQHDNSLLDEYLFAHEPDWVKNQIHRSLEFWHGEREPSYAPEEERWKCQRCQFENECPLNNVNPETSASSSQQENPIRYN